MSGGVEAGSVDGQVVHEQVAPVAEQTLAHFEKVGEAATSALSLNRPITLDAFASMNLLSAEAASKRVDLVNQKTRSDLLMLAAEPAIARVVVQDEAGRQQTIFIARAAPLGPAADDYWTASYRSPLGRLAALEVGDEIEVVRAGVEVVYRVVDRARLRPQRAAGQWDARNTVFESENVGPITIVSLRAAISAAGLDPSDLDVLDALLAGDREASNIIDGLTRVVVEKMGLRDQAVLDRYQDEIFRLPLDVRLAIMGPPGAGKTTTLIKRLGLKLDHRHFEDAERAQVARTAAGLDGHRSSWMMFTPTELLKQYIKEAFNREEVPASDLRIQSWADYRMTLGRRELGLLRSAGRRGAILREGLVAVTPRTVRNQIEWFEDFEAWQRERYWGDLAEHAKSMLVSKDPKIVSLGNRLNNTVAASSATPIAPALLAVTEAGREIAELTGELRRSIDVRTRTSLAAHLRQDPTLLDSFGAFLGTLADVGDETEDPDFEEDEEDEEAPLRRGDRELAFEAYKSAVRAQARAAAERRSIGRRTRTGQILSWLGERTLSQQDRADLGEQLRVLRALQRFSGPVRRYLAGMLGRYRQFRRVRQTAGLWYVADPIAATDLAPAEADIVILSTLRAGRALLADRTIGGLLEEPGFGLLRSIRGLMRNQIVVDEATDFSPIELACMVGLADPSLDSFVMCGDFNQRITTGGVRSERDLRWIVPDVDIRSITVTYRHSRPLAELSEALVALAGGEPLGARLPDHMSAKGFSPVLALGLDRAAMIDWLASRIREIDAHLGGQLPSIAVLVSGEEDVAPVAEGLDAALAASNIPCTACPNGQVRGQDNEVRVFDVQHIKGLEFEAVFFADIDQLARREPELFDKFLYVGATRAATYLGLTCATAELPEKLRPVASRFRDSWVPG